MSEKLKTLIVIDGDNLCISLGKNKRRMNPEIFMEVLRERGVREIVGAHFFLSHQGKTAEAFRVAGFEIHHGPLTLTKGSIADAVLELLIWDHIAEFDRLVLVSNDGGFNQICRSLREYHGKHVWRVVFASHHRQAKAHADVLISLGQIGPKTPGLIYDKRSATT